MHSEEYSLIGENVEFPPSDVVVTDADNSVSVGRTSLSPHYWLTDSESM